MPRYELVRPILLATAVWLPLSIVCPAVAQINTRRAVSGEMEYLQRRIQHLESRLAYNRDGRLPGVAELQPLPPVRLPEDRPERLPEVEATEAERIDELRGELSRLQQQLADLQSQTWANQNSIAQVAAAPLVSPEQMRQEITQWSESVRNRMDATEARVASFDTRVASVGSNLDGLQHDLGAFQLDFKEAEQALNEQQSVLDKIGTEDWFKEKMTIGVFPDYITKHFEMHGYLRTGYGVNGRGGGIEEFQVPDALFEIGWRLGNEKDTYGELSFEYQRNRHEPKKIQTLIKNTLAFKYREDKSNYTTDESADILVRESYVKVWNFLPNHPDVEFWVGEQFYDRHDIYIIDLFALDMSAWGGGFTGIDLGIGKLWIAYLGGTRDRLRDYGGVGTLTEQHLDIRLKDVEMIGGKSMFWLDLAYVKGGSFTDFDIQSPFLSNVGDQAISGNFRAVTYDNVEFESEFGPACGILHERSLFGGWNKTLVMYGVGAGADFNAYIVVGKPPGAVADQERLFIANWHQIDINEKLGLMTLFLLDYDNVGQGNDGTYGYGFSQPKRRLVMLGARPIFMITDYLALKFEAGVDYTNEIRYTPEVGDDAWVSKFTIAPCVRGGRGFWDRPELRLFATYACWSEHAQGLVGLPAYSQSRQGWNFGVQAETWW